MKKIVKLKESDLQRIVNRVIRESMISELGGMDDGHPFSGEMNFNDLPLKDRERVNKYYRLDDVEVDNSYSELDSELEDDFEDYDLEIGDDMPSYKTKWSMPSDEEDEYPKPKRMFNRNSERPFRPRPFNRD
jgi:hypothetical protein